MIVTNDGIFLGDNFKPSNLAVEIRLRMQGLKRINGKWFWQGVDLIPFSYYQLFNFPQPYFILAN